MCKDIYHHYMGKNQLSTTRILIKQIMVNCTKEYYAEIVKGWLRYTSIDMKSVHGIVNGATKTDLKILLP